LSTTRNEEIRSSNTLPSIITAILCPDSSPVYIYLRYVLQRFTVRFRPLQPPPSPAAGPSHRSIPLFDSSDVASVPARDPSWRAALSLLTRISLLPRALTPGLTSPSSAPTALTRARSDPAPRLPHHRPGHLDTVRNFCDPHSHHCTATARPSSRPLPPSLVRTAPVFYSSGSFVLICFSVTRSTLRRDGTGHNSERERAINTVRRNRSFIRHAARNAAAALCRSALPERRPHQVGERLGAWRVTAPVRLIALFVATTAAATSRVPFHPPTAHERPAVPFTLADAHAHGHAQQQQLHS
jgi:hypothetical protein